MRVKVLRAFCIRGERQEPGKEIEVADHLVVELVFLGKAERVGAVASAPAGPMTTESVPDLVQGKARKGAKDAGE
jgi:hypothetical protein